MGVDGLDIMRSKSLGDLSSIEMLFKPGTNELRARQLVQERMATVIPTLPTWAAPPVMMPPVSVTGRFMKIGLSSDTIPLTDMSMIAYWTIRARLLRVPGVANVCIWGERIKMPQVRVDPDRMAAHNVTLEDVMETTADALDVGILYFSRRGDDRHRRLYRYRRISAYNIRPVSSLKSQAELAIVPIGDQEEGGWHAARLERRGRRCHRHLAALRRRRHQWRPWIDARHAEISLGQHARGDPWRRSGH